MIMTLGDVLQIFSTAALFLGIAYLLIMFFRALGMAGYR